jgi:hypothetical protein
MNHTYNGEACTFLKILLETDAVWNFSRYTLNQATATSSSEICQLFQHFVLDVLF